jgi:peptidoglycan/LPS O-acetylase OafA/YrhL
MPAYKRLPPAVGRWRKGKAGSAEAERNQSPDLSTINRELAGILNLKVISGLDAVRALAISLVLLAHFWLGNSLGWLHPDLGSMGVMIFFVLSGFLITSMLLKEYRKSGSISLRNFYRRRVFRIFPTFYVCWILTTIVESLAHRIHWKTAVISFFYMMDYGRALAPAALLPYMHLGISWSLAIEEKFYLLWPLLLLLLLNKRSTLIRTLSLIILVQWTYRAILYLVFHVHWDYVYNAFDTRADALLSGCLLAVLVANEKTRLSCCWLLRWQLLSAVPVLALALITLVPPPPTPNRYFYLVLWTIQPPLIAASLLQFVYWGAKSWTICGTVPVRFVARISYALYLYHPLAGEIIYVLHVRHLGYSTAILTLLMSTASYYWIERPMMRIRDRVSVSPRSPAPEVLGAS